MNLVPGTDLNSAVYAAWIFLKQNLINQAMRNTNGRVVIYNAMNDFTERDKANAQYRLLIANKFKQDIQQLELQQANAFNICIRAAIRDLSVWMAVIVFMALVLYSVSW